MDYRSQPGGHECVDFEPLFSSFDERQDIDQESARRDLAGKCVSPRTFPHICEGRKWQVAWSTQIPATTGHRWKRCLCQRGHWCHHSLPIDDVWFTKIEHGLS